MRKSSLRALLLAIVMAVQAIAGGLGAVHAAPGAAGAAWALCASADKAHLDQLQAGKATDDGQGQRHEHCDACCLSGVSGAAVVPNAATAPASTRDGHLVGFLPRDTRILPASLGHRQFARGPPVDSSRL
jgi:hypothetical protein